MRRGVGDPFSDFPGCSTISWITDCRTDGSYCWNLKIFRFSLFQDIGLERLGSCLHSLLAPPDMFFECFSPTRLQRTTTPTNRTVNMWIINSCIEGPTLWKQGNHLSRNNSILVLRVLSLLAGALIFDLGPVKALPITVLQGIARTDAHVGRTGMYQSTLSFLLLVRWWFSISLCQKKRIGTLSELLTDAAADVFSLLFGAEAYQSVSLLFAG